MWNYSIINKTEQGVTIQIDNGDTQFLTNEELVELITEQSTPAK